MRYFPMHAAVCLAVMTAAGAAWPASDPNDAQSYALRLPLAFAADAPLQRLILPAQALVSLQTGGLSDVRIFNAKGQPLAMALSDSASLRQTDARRCTGNHNHGVLNSHVIPSSKMVRERE